MNLEAITNENVILFSSLLRGRNDVYGSYDLNSGRYYVVKEPITDEIIRRHIAGIKPLGVYMLKIDRVGFAVVDFDKPDKEIVTAFVKKAGEMGLPVYVERSKGKGFHVWCWFESDVLASIVRKVLRHILTGIGESDVEVFPKQDSLPPDGFGNFINCPLFGKLVEQGRTAFVDEAFLPYADQWKFLKSVKRVSESALNSALIRLNENPETTRQETTLNHPIQSDSIVTSKTYGLLPCVVKMLENGVTQNQRCSAFRLAVHLKRTGMPFGATVAVLNEWAKKNKPDDNRRIITALEIREQAESAYRRPYAGRGCHDPSVMPFCDEKCVLKRVRTSA